MMSLHEWHAYAKKLEDQLRDERHMIKELRKDLSYQRHRTSVLTGRWNQAARSLARERGRAERAIAEMMRLRTYAQRIGLSLSGFRRHKQEELASAND